MLANLLVIAFVGFMAYWWGSQGVFSALLHLVSVIIAGALALALWESIAQSLLINALAPYAWGLALLGPFIIILLIVRNAFDYLIKSNVHFHQIINLCAGGVLGLCSGILTAGITLIALSFMSLGHSIGGYEPYMVGPAGEVVEHPSGALWLGVEHRTAGFFSMLSTGTFSSKTPLAYRMPKLARQAGTFRLHADNNASVVATPGAVTLGDAWIAATPFRALDPSTGKVIGDKVRQPDHQVVVIDTQWKASAPTYDGDNTLRLSPSQITLITRGSDPDSERTLVHPIGAGKLDGASGRRFYTPFDSDQAMVAGVNPQDSFAWVFVIPADQQVQDLLIRRLRLAPTLKQADDKTVAAVGEMVGRLPAELESKYSPAPAVAAGDGTEGTVGAREGMRTGSIAAGISIDRTLPIQFSQNHVNGSMNLQGQQVQSGRFTVRLPEGVRVSRENMINEIYCPGHQQVVKVRVQRDQAQSILGRSRAAAAMLSPIRLDDSANNQWFANGYAWVTGEGQMEVSMDPISPMRSARETPIAEMKDSDQLDLYFIITKGVTLTSYHIGQTRQEVNLEVK